MANESIPAVLRDPALLTAALLAEYEREKASGGGLDLEWIESELAANRAVSGLGDFVGSLPLFQGRHPGEVADEVRKVVDIRNQVQGL